MARKNYYEYFFGNKVSDYGLKNGYVDYLTLSKAFNHVINNEITSKTEDWEIVNGSEYDDETDSYEEVFQWYIIPEYGAEILQRYTNEIVYYSDEFNMYIWGVTHFGTSWDYVLTDIKLKEKDY